MEMSYNNNKNDNDEQRRKEARAKRFATTTGKDQVGLISRGAQNRLDTREKQIEFCKHLQQQVYYAVDKEWAAYCTNGMWMQFKCCSGGRGVGGQQYQGKASLVNGIRALREAVTATRIQDSPFGTQVLEFSVKVGVALGDEGCYGPPLNTLVSSNPTSSSSTIIPVYILTRLYLNMGQGTRDNPLGLCLETVQSCLETVYKCKTTTHSWLIKVITCSIEGDYHQFLTHLRRGGGDGDLGVDKIIHDLILPIWYKYTLKTMAKSYKRFPVNELHVPHGHEYPIENGIVLFAKK